ncbi:ATP phosphoribosyltransferase, partial [Mycobacterium sp. ITM-2017-0098]
KDLTVVDPSNNVEFFFLRPKDIAIYVGSGELDLGITGRDLAQESDAPVAERLSLGFGSSTFRYAAPAGTDWTVSDLAGQRIATA